MKKISIPIITLALSLWICGSLAQGVAINDDNSPPDGSAMLDVSSTLGGVLIPRMSSTERLSIPSPATGLLVYQTNGDDGFYYYNGSVWTRFNTESAIWTDEGSYLSPLGPIGPGLRIADDEANQYGFYSAMNTGTASGYGAYFSHTSSSGSTYGLYASSAFTGSSNSAYSYGAYISSSSNNQDQRGLYNYNVHTGSTGWLTGLENSSELASGNGSQLIGIKSVTYRNGAENNNYGIQTQATRGTSVYGTYSTATLGAANYGLYGIAETAATSYGLYARGESWGGWLEHNTSGKYVKLGGSSYAMQIHDGSEAAGKVLTSADASGNVSWQDMPTQMWTDTGIIFITPVGLTNSLVAVATDDAYPVGISVNHNSGTNGGYGGSFTQIHSENTGTGIEVSSIYNGSGTSGTTYGALISTQATTQDEIGLYLHNLHTGTTGTVTGIQMSTSMPSGNYEDLYGIKLQSTRYGTEDANNGIWSKATAGDIVTGVYGIGENGEYETTGLYGSASSSTGSSWGIYAEGSTYGGTMICTSSGKFATLGGSTFAVKAYGDIILNSIWDAYVIGDDDVLRIPNGDTTNIAVGFHAGPVSTGSHNTFLGSLSGYNISSPGWDNTLIGYKTGMLKTSGHGNTFIGSAAGLNNVSGQYNVFLGYQAGYSESGSNKLYISNSNTSSPLIYGEFDNDRVKINGDLGIRTTPISSANFQVDGDELYAGYFTSNAASANAHIVHAKYDGTGLANVLAVYGEATMSSHTFNYGTGGGFVGDYMGIYGLADAEGDTTISLAVYGSSYGYEGIRYGVYGDADGNSGEILYGIYGYAPSTTNSYAVACSGNGYYTGTWTHLTDQALNKNVVKLSGGLDMVMQLQPNSFEYADDVTGFLDAPPGKHFGFDLQKLKEVVPDLVGSARVPTSINSNPPIRQFTTINTIELIPVLTEAIQEQQEIIETQQKQIDVLQERIEMLESR